MSAKLLVPTGGTVHSSGGDKSSPSQVCGRGIGSQLAKGALDQVRKRGMKVVPLCPFIKAYIEKHAEYQDLLK